MAEPTLNLKLTDLESAIGEFLGYGLGAANGGPAWTTDQQSKITRMRNSGERQFYHPAIDGVIYVWSFLRPFARLTLPAGVNTLPMPDDFGGIEGEITATNLGSLLWETVPQIADVRPLYARNPTLTGRPRMCDVEPIKGSTPAASTRHQLYVWPSPDQDYQLQLQYYVNPNAMNGVLPYALGGPQHAETLQAACIAAAELYLDDAPGPRAAYFQERLMASVNMDKKLRPQLLGYNRDRSDMVEIQPYGAYPARGWNQPFVEITYYGVGYP